MQRVNQYKIQMPLNLSALFLSGVFLISARADDISSRTNEGTYWTNVLERVKVVYAVKNDHSTIIKDEYREEGNQLRIAVVQRLKDDSVFTQLVRKSLRNDNRVWVRAFSASILIKAFEQADASDYIYMLSDPDSDVKGFGIAAIHVYKIQDAADSLPVGLFSKQAQERLSTVIAIRDLLGWKGLPYYVELLYDSDEDVASEAAKSFQSCKIEDAVPHLLNYLRMNGKSDRKAVVVKCVIKSLCDLHGEPFNEKAELNKTVDEWVKRLGKEANNHS